MKIGNLQSMPWYLRLMMFVAVAGVMYAGFWYFVTRPTRAETEKFKTKLHSFCQRTRRPKSPRNDLNEFRRSIKRGKEEYEELKALLPEQRELTMVLQGVQDRARGNGLVLRNSLPRKTCSKETTAARRSK